MTILTTVSRRAGIALLAIACLVAPAQAAQNEAAVRVVVKPDVVVSTRDVTLADVATIGTTDAGLRQALGALAVARAPRIGAMEPLGRESLEKIVRTQYPHTDLAIDWSGARIVKLRSASQIVGSAALAKAAADGISGQLAHRFDALDIQPQPLPVEVAVPRGAVLLKTRPLDAGQLYARMPVWVDVFVDGALYRSVVVTVSLVAEQSVLVARRDLVDGATVTPQDFNIVRQNVAGVHDPVAADGLPTGGARMKKGLVAGQVLTRGVLHEGGAVVRGDWVTLVHASGGIALQTRALVEQSGHMGDVVKVKPQKSTESVAGRIVAPGIVETYGR